MRLGIVADEIDRDFARALEVGTGLGLRRYEIRFLRSGRAPMCDPEELLDVERRARQEGAEITALSPGLFKFTEDAAEFARELKEIYPRAAEWAHRWNLGGLIVFGFHKPGSTEENAGETQSHDPPPQVVEWLTQAGERAQADGLQLLIEPEPICWADSGAATAALIQRTGSAALRINYDPGNVAWLTGRDPLDEFASVADYISNVHVKDLRLQSQGRRPEFLPAGEGMIQYREHFAALKRAGYNGPVSLEPHMDGRAETIRRCKEACERLWASA
jgi:sugar phosphate isomerase/epimerase